MRRIDDYKNEELVALTDEEINMIIDLECAFEGVPMLPPEPKPLEDTPLEKTEVGYKIDDMESVYFSQEDAEEILKLIMSKPMLVSDYNRNYEVQFLRQADRTVPKVSKRLFYNENTAATEENRRLQLKPLKTNYEAAKKVYDEALKGRSGVQELVFEKIREAQSIEATKQRYNTIWDTYINMAKGDITIAADFFVKAYGSGALHSYLPDVVKQITTADNSEPVAIDEMEPIAAPCEE